MLLAVVGGDRSDDLLHVAPPLAPGSIPSVMDIQALLGRNIKVFLPI
jgi:hypothetical protein